MFKPIYHLISTCSKQSVGGWEAFLVVLAHWGDL